MGYCSDVFERELNRVASQGYVLKGFQYSKSGSYIVIMEKDESDQSLDS